MSMPYFDLYKAHDQIENGAVLDTRDIVLGQHVISVEKIATIWHLQRPSIPDFVFRLLLDGVPVRNDFGREFYHACSDYYRSHNPRYRILIGKDRPDWLPKGVTIATADKLLDKAMVEMLSAN